MKERKINRSQQIFMKALKEQHYTPRNAISLLFQQREQHHHSEFRSWGVPTIAEHTGAAYLCLVEDSSSFSVSEWHSSFSFSITWFWDWIMPSSSATVWAEMGPQNYLNLHGSHTVAVSQHYICWMQWLQSVCVWNSSKLHFGKNVSLAFAIYIYIYI